MNMRHPHTPMEEYVITVWTKSSTWKVCT